MEFAISDGGNQADARIMYGAAATQHYRNIVYIPKMKKFVKYMEVVFFNN